MDLISYAMGKQASGGGSQPTGTIEITSNGTHDVSNYASANVNVPGVSDYLTSTAGNTVGSLLKTILEGTDFTTISTKSLYYFFSGCTNLEHVPYINTTGVTNTGQMFSYCSNLKSVELFDTSSVTNMRSMFESCSNLETVPIFDTTNVTEFGRMFYGCRKLETVPILNFSSATTLGSMFSDCFKLSNESVNNIMASCIGATSYTGTKTLKILGVSQAKRQIASGLSNYQAFLDAGWTTGD